MLFITIVFVFLQITNYKYKKKRKIAPVLGHKVANEDAARLRYGKRWQLL